MDITPPHLATSGEQVQKKKKNPHHPDNFTAPPSILLSRENISKPMHNPMAFPFEHTAEQLLHANTPLLHGTDAEAKRLEIRDYFHRTFTMFERLHDVLADDKYYYYQPERLRHPLVFYFGHTAVFHINKLNIAGYIKQRVDPSIESMCAIGVDEMSWDDLNPSHYNWPSIPRLREYRNAVRHLVDGLIMKSPLTLPITWDSVFWVILMGIEHERIHLETSSVLFRQLPPQFVRETALLQRFQASPEVMTQHRQRVAQRTQTNNQALIDTAQHTIAGVDIVKEVKYTLPQQYETPDAAQRAYAEYDNKFITFSPHLFNLSTDLSKARSITTKTIPTRRVTLGKGFTHHLYGWDNEYGEDTEDVMQFEAATTLITNQQFLLFMLSGGYYQKDFWQTAEGWAFAQYKTQVLKQPWPTFWSPVGPEVDTLTYPTPTAAILEGTASVLESNSNLTITAHNNHNSSSSPPIAAPAAGNVTAPSLSMGSGTAANNCSVEDALTAHAYEPHTANSLPTTPTHNPTTILTTSASSSTAHLNKNFDLPTGFNSTMRIHGLPFNTLSQLHIHNFQYRWLSGLIDMPWDHPVDINNLEAQAYTKWVQSLILPEEFAEELRLVQNYTPDTALSTAYNKKQCRIPTEWEYKSMVLHIMTTYGALELSADKHNTSIPTDTMQPVHNIYDYDHPLIHDKMSPSSPTELVLEQNIDLRHASSSPADYYSYFNSGFYDVIGNVWQHCSSVIYPFKTFKVHPVYDDFTVPTFDNMHGIIAGGSWISTGNEAGYHARYAFRRHFYQHAGCRLGFFTTAPKTAQLQSIEQDVNISNMLHNDWYDLLTNEDLLQTETLNNKKMLQNRAPNSKQSAKLIFDTINKLCATQELRPGWAPQHIMVLGCRGGRLPIELADLYRTAHIVGIDTTVRLLGSGLRLLDGLQVSYFLKSSYEQQVFARVRENALINYLQDHGCESVSALKKRVALLQTDVVNLPEDKVPRGTYDCIVVDCLDTAYNPKLLLQNILKHAAAHCHANKQSVIALCIYHTWSSEQGAAANNVWGYRDENTGEFINVERGVGLIAPELKLVRCVDNNPRIRRLNTHVYNHIDMSCYFYLYEKND